MTTKDALIEKLKELIQFYESKLSVGEIHSGWDIASKIVDLESQVEQETKTAEEILSQITGIPTYRMKDNAGEYVTKKAALISMHEFRNQSLKLPTKEEIEDWAKEKSHVLHGFKHDSGVFDKNKEADLIGGANWAIKYMTGQELNTK